MIWDVVKAAVNQPKERIGGQMLTYLWCNDGHGKPRHENITSFKSGGIFASRFTKCQCSSHGEHSPWRLSGNCCLNYKGEPISERGIRKLVVKYRKNAGITKRASCHTLRHTFATYKAEKGVSPFQLQQWLGHANLNTQK